MTDNNNKKYQIIYADPPWKHRGVLLPHSAGVDPASHYPVMDIKELCGMAPYVSSLTDSTACLLFMWISSPMLPEAMTLIDAWGFEYKTVAFVWHKQRPLPGFYTMSDCELCLVAKAGKIPQPRGARNIQQFLSLKRREHSRKPNEVRERIEKMFPTQNKIELFARQTTPGWDVYGNETEKFAAKS
jgi:N6-adenosine-specific RNA methylase IME4